MGDTHTHYPVIKAAVCTISRYNDSLCLFCTARGLLYLTFSKLAYKVVVCMYVSVNVIGFHAYEAEDPIAGKVQPYMKIQFFATQYSFFFFLRKSTINPSNALYYVF